MPRKSLTPRTKVLVVVSRVGLTAPKQELPVVGVMLRHFSLAHAADPSHSDPFWKSEHHSRRRSRRPPRLTMPRVLRTAASPVDSTVLYMRPMRLVTPAPEWQEAFQDMARDYEQAGESRYTLALRDFSGFLRRLDRDRRPRGLFQGWVPSLQFWLEDRGVLLARASLRLRLTAALEREGGHIGYDVRPSARRKGLGTELLRLTLIEAYARGIRRVRITCDDDNVGSRKIIERNGGVFADHGVSDDSGKLVRRYWIASRVG